MSYYPVPGSHFSDKVELNLDFSNNVTKKKLSNARGADTFNLAAKR